MGNALFRFFEKLVNPFPSDIVGTPPKDFWAFAWRCTKGMRPQIISMTLLTALIGAFEALLFAMMGTVVDWLAKIQPDQFWAQEKKKQHCSTLF